MSGRPDFNIPAFNLAAAQLRQFGYTVTSPPELQLPCGCSSGRQCTDQPHDWSEWLRSDIIGMMVHADAVATLPVTPGWPRSRGMAAELALAETFGWPIKPVSEWLQMVWFPELRPGQLLPTAVPYPGTTAP